MAETTSAVAAASSKSLDDRIAHEHLRLVRRQIGRMPPAYVLVDVVLTWLLTRVGLWWPGLLWLAALFVVQVWRWRYVRRLEAGLPADPKAALRRLDAMLQTVGLLRGAMVPILFLQPLQSEHYIFTMVYVGMLAGAVASVGGRIGPFVAWAVLACGSLALAWAWQGSVDGIWIGILIVALIAVLAGHVRDQGDGLRQFVKLACDNETLANSLRAARDATEAASLSKTRFFAAASHDLRQPLHALSINATTLELVARRQDDPLIKDISHSINRALNQSNGLLDSLLDISNLDANAVRPQFQSVDPAGLLGSVRDGFAALAAQKGLALRLDVDDAMPAVLTDPDLLRRMLNNLVANALKFSHAGSVTLSAHHMPSERGSGAVIVAVSDTGPGIPAAEHERVFDEFYQLDNTSRDRSKGLGLGLSIVKRTAALLGASLQLHSSPGQGTSVELVLDQTVTLAEPPAGAEPDASVESGMLPGLRVLVVDDEPDILTSLHTLLTQLGCAVHCAEDGRQATALLDAGFLPQVLLVDHRLRRESGAEVIAGICAVLGPVPAVLVTGDTEPATIQLAHAAGHRVIHKPVQGRVLAQVLRETAGECSV